MEQRLVVLEQHHGIVEVGDVDLRQPRGDIAVPPDRRDHPRRQLHPPAVDGALAASRPRHQAVDDRQVELRILGPELVDDRAGLIDEV